jgi:hypothetical protein
MPTTKFKSARAYVDFVTGGVVPAAERLLLPIASMKVAQTQPASALRGKIVLGIERHASGQFVMYRRLPDLKPLHYSSAVPVGVGIEIRLRVGNKNATDALLFPITEGNVIDATDPAFTTAPLLIYIEKGVNATGASVFNLLSVGLAGGGAGDPCAGCEAPATDEARVLFALLGCYSA